MARAWIISTGTELTLGQTLDRNAAWLAEQLAALGVATERIVIVPDARDAIRDAIAQAARACEVVIITGGLGPTNDDVTRQALADAAGLPLELDQACLARLRAFFTERGREMPDANRVQALMPRTARALPNWCGTAPGLALTVEGARCYALPGVPFEMMDMFQREVAPELETIAAGQVLVSRRLRCFGTPESELGVRLRDWMVRGRNPEVGTTAELGEITLHIRARAPSGAEAQTLLDDAEREIRRRLGIVVFGRDDETLAGVVGRLLLDATATLSTAESCTGGLVGEMLTAVPGSSRYYLGGVVAYANEVKQQWLHVSPQTLERHGAVSEAVARAMAAGARAVFGSSYALAVTGIAGPAGGSVEKPVGLVFLGLASPRSVSARQLLCGPQTPRQVIRERAARSVLNLLRLELLGVVENR